MNIYNRHFLMLFCGDQIPSKSFPSKIIEKKKITNIQPKMRHQPTHPELLNQVNKQKIVKIMYLRKEKKKIIKKI